MKDKEMKLMEFARIVDDMEIGDVIDFKNAPEEEYASSIIGIQRVGFFDDTTKYVIGTYYHEGETELYHIGLEGSCDTREDFVVSIGKMIADYLLTYEGYVNDVLTVRIYNDTERS